MGMIIYRPIRKGDYAQVKDIICKAFSLDAYITNEKLLDAVKSQYLYSCLSEATYTCVAEKDGQTVGVIMGNAKSDYSAIKHIPYLIKDLWYGMKMVLYGRRYRKQAAGYKDIHTIYREFSAKHKGEFDGVLTLFAVNQDCRGFGIGKNLLERLMDYLENQKVKHIYLYTDTTCTYEFYEHRGFERLESKELQMERGGKPFQMEVFLYGYLLAKGESHE